MSAVKEFNPIISEEYNMVSPGIITFSIREM
jgi:hypothetical protein